MERLHNKAQRRRVSVASLSLFFNMLAVLLVVLLGFQTDWTRNQLQDWVRSQGVPAVSFEVERLTPSQLVLGSIAFEEAMKAPEVRELRLEAWRHWLDLMWRLLRGEVASWTLFVEMSPVDDAFAGPMLEAEMQALWRSSRTLSTSGRPLDSSANPRPTQDFTIEADWRLQPLSLDQALRFAEGLPGLESQLAEWEITDPVGQIEAEGRLNWHQRPDADAQPPRISADLGLSDIGLELPWFEVIGLDADIRIEDLLKPRIPKGQRIRVAELNPGVPLRNTELHFGLEGDKLRIQRLDAQFAGGYLRLDPLTTRLTDQRRRLGIEVERLDLAQLLVEVPIDDLSLTGQLSGRIPVIQEGATIRIDQGRLAALGPGVIRYGSRADSTRVLAADRLPGGSSQTTPPPAQGGMDLMLRALEDFHYSELAAQLDGQTGKDLSLRLSVLGSNPALYAGYPIRLNVNVTGALDEILKSGLDTSRIGREAGELFRLQP